MHPAAMSSCLILTLLTTFAAYVDAAASCECGYTLNSTTEPNTSYTLFTDLLETDFLHLYTLPDSISVPASKQIGWAPQAYNVSPVAARGPYGKSAEVGNVVLNPLNDTYDWGGVEGKNGGDPGLQIWVRGVSNTSEWSTPGSDVEGQMVRMGEIDSLRQDVRYGSFRIGMKMAAVEGTCAAFFWYRNNTQEIDMEYLSRQAYTSNSSSKLNLVIQSPLSAALGYNAAPTQTYTLHDLPFLPDEDYHEYRFDWTPSQIALWVDGVFLASFDQYDPDAAGTMMLNHWSNGDPNWSGGPPATDTAITISYIKAYFNSTNTTRNDEWVAGCGIGCQGRICEISAFPDQGISPLGPNGNNTGKTDFFLYQGAGAVVNQTLYPAAVAKPGKGGSVSGSGKAEVEWGGLVVGVLMGLRAGMAWL